MITPQEILDKKKLDRRNRGLKKVYIYSEEDVREVLDLLSSGLQKKHILAKGYSEGLYLRAWRDSRNKEKSVD